MTGRFLFGKQTLVVVENRYAELLLSKGFTMKRGWNKEIARALVEHSREEEIRRMTPRDGTERFKDTTRAQRWHESRERVIYTLYHEEVLVGIVWFSNEQKPLLDAEYTLAIRLYGDARGHGLAGNFLEAALHDFREIKQYKGGYWLATDITNVRAQHLYVGHRFEEVGRDGSRLIMVRRDSLL